MTMLAREVSHYGPITASPFASDVLQGLSRHPKSLPPKYFYDHRGSELFEQITELPEYYPTRCELRILRDRASEIAQLFPYGGVLVEFGSGSSKKVRLLLQAATQLAGYVPVDISGEFLQQEAAQLRREYPIAVLPVAADFTQPFHLPRGVESLPRCGFFPGSTIGNFEPDQAMALLRHAGRVLGRDAILIVGVDLVKDIEVLQRAYNDAQGVTAAFNLNLLKRINRELGADFDFSKFEHRAFYNREHHRIEMHLASLCRQRVRACGQMIEFLAGETIHTENSYKYTVPSFAALARDAGWSPVEVWTDPDRCFSVHALKFGERGARSART
ncbi:MAG TPA: L-histidine N(alpha)-methyltransferase [Xanthobacteraceae bacterium]|jgi:dimethylhistidine N-methyltransferase